MLRRVIGEDIELTIRAGAAPFAVNADPRQLEQVIMKLVSNARAAMPEGGTLTIETSNAEFEPQDVVDRLLLQSGPYVVLEIRDTGHGIDAHTKAHLFEPFFRPNMPTGQPGLAFRPCMGL
jgi:signal transduction histidine kinase